MPKTKTAYILFGRAPILGFGKSRLAKTLGKKLTLSLYRLCLQFQLENMQSIGSENSIFFLDLDLPANEKTSLRDFKYLLKNLGLPFFKLRKQEGINLGKRMEHSIFTALKKSDYAVLQGIDVPCLLPNDYKIIKENQPQTVFVPAYDGGWMSMGIHKDYAFSGMFDNIPWSHPKTFWYTIKNFKEKNNAVVTLDPRPDLDSVRDLLLCGRWLWQAPYDLSLAKERVRKAIKLFDKESPLIK